MVVYSWRKDGRNGRIRGDETRRGVPEVHMIFRNKRTEETK